MQRKRTPEEQARITKYIHDEFAVPLIGETIAMVREMEDDEKMMFGWEGRWDAPIVIQLSNGTILIPSRDEEGNGPGHLIVQKT